MPKGGRQPGAGRPKAQHTIATEALRAYIVEQVVANKEAIVAQLIIHAKKGKIDAIKELFDRSMGRPIAFDVPQGSGSLTIQWQNPQEK